MPRSKSISRKKKQGDWYGTYFKYRLIFAAVVAVLGLLRLMVMGLPDQDDDKPVPERNKPTPTKTVKPKPSRVKTVKQRAEP